MNTSDATTGGGSAGEVTAEQWQFLEGLWKAILSLEANIDAARLSANTLRSEMETAFRQSLNVDEKLHASQADIGEWNRAKNRLHFALPKVREFIHRANWAATVPERKRLEEVVRDHIEPRVPPPDLDQVREEMEHLLKARQVLFSQGTSVQSECRSLTADTQRALGNLKRNAANNARKKKGSKW